MSKQWYPGLMAKGKKSIKHYLKMVQLVIEVLEARAPYSSRNPELTKMLSGKKKVIVLNKADLADKKITRSWQEALKEEAEEVFACSSKSKGGMADLIKYLHVFKKGMKSSSFPSLMVVGVPNVGKSTITNHLLGRKSAATGGKPGITKGPQWVKVPYGWFILDTPGLLAPKIKNDDNIYCLAALGSYKEDLLDIEELAWWLVNKFNSLGFTYSCWQQVYDLPEAPSSWEEVINLVSKRRGFLEKGGRVNMQRGSRAIIKDFRDGKLLPLSLEKPDDLEEDDREEE